MISWMEGKGDLYEALEIIGDPVFAFDKRTNSWWMYSAEYPQEGCIKTTFPFPSYFKITAKKKRDGAWLINVKASKEQSE